jgi:hypothetical protein
LSFTEGLASDHRALFVDLCSLTLLSSTPSLIASSSTRALNSGNPAKVDKYNEEMTKYYEDNKIFDRMTRLKQQSPRMSRKKVRRRLNVLDRDMGRAMLDAENRKTSFAYPHVNTRGLLNCKRQVCSSDTGNPVLLTSTRNPRAIAHMLRYNNDCNRTIVDINYPLPMTWMMWKSAKRLVKPVRNFVRSERLISKVASRILMSS